ncbi:DotA/TraY family protein [Brenneria populi]|uniref:DotA/TraY family protein n=1 Tax=Brenneria populi TaxID=1505588 RepID=A0ABU6JR52_9GAMM|nr:DotA/TraY family protein [Brenneria populi Li et al. 2015]
MKNIKKKELSAILLAILVCLLLIQSAHAADLFTVPETDKSKLWVLDILFPEDLSKSPLSSMFTILNSAVLLVGGILAAYTLIAGTMSTAHDGEMLGKKWSSMWLPVRTALGTAMILPAAGGFCAAQVAVLWMINQGVGLADTIWNTYAANPSDGAVITTSASYQELDSVAKTAFINHVCMIKADELWTKSFKNMPRSGQPKFGITEDKTASVIAYYYGANNEGNEMNKSLLYSRSACGVITLTDPDGVKEQASGIAMRYSGYVPKDLQGEVNEVITTQYSEFKRLDEKMETLAHAYVADNNLDLQTYINSAVDNYVNNIDVKVKALFSDGSKWDGFKENIQQDGWFMAGAWSMKLIRIQDAINGAAHKLPKAGIGTLKYEDIFDSQLKAIMDKVGQDMARTTSASKYANGLDKQIKSKNTEEDILKDRNEKGAKDAGIIVNSLKTEADKSLSGAITGFLNRSVINGMKQGDIVSFSTDTTRSNLQAVNPILGVKSLGDTITWAGWGLVGGGAIAGLASGSVWGGIQTAMVLAVPLWMAGDTLSVIIPMMPYLMWFGVCFGWIVLCVEAMVAAPLWVVVHLNPDGDGVVGRGGAGYSLVLSLTLRPALMVIGFIAALTIMPILGGIVNETFGGAFSMMAGDSFIGLIEGLAVIGLYAYTMIMVVRKSMSLIHVLPDEVMKWMGAHSGQNMGGYAQSATKGVEAAQFTQASLNQMSHALNGINNLGNQKKSNDQQKQQQELMRQQKQQDGQKQASNRARETGSSFRTHMSNAGPLDQQNEYQSLETANSAYNAAEAAEEVGDTAGAAGYMDVAQKAANRAVSFGEHNRPLLPQNLQSKGTPIENFKAPDKGGSNGSSGGSEEPSQ